MFQRGQITPRFKKTENEQKRARHIAPVAVILSRYPMGTKETPTKEQTSDTANGAPVFIIGRVNAFRTRGNIAYLHDHEITYLFTLKHLKIMATMTFKNVDFSEFVNFYFNVSSADEITTDDEMKNFLISRYNEKVTLQIYDGKFTPFARVIFADGETLDDFELGDEDEFLAAHETHREHADTHNGHEIFKVRVFGSTIYAAALWADYPDFFSYFATCDDVKTWYNKRESAR